MVNQFDVFLSYSRTDKAIMKKVQQILIENNLNVWVDELIELGSPSWTFEIQNALKNSHTVVVLMSPDAAVSKYVDMEIGYAEGLGIRIYPVLARNPKIDAVPLSLIRVQYTDITQVLDKNLELLASSILEYIESVINQKPGFNNETINRNYPQRIKRNNLLASIPPIPLEISSFKNCKFEKFEHIASIEKSRTTQRDQQDGEYPFYGINGIKNYVRDYVYDGEYLVIPNVVVINNPVVFLVDGKFSADQHVFIARANSDTVSTQFLYWILQNIDLINLANGTTTARLSKLSLSKLNIPLPSLSEQEKFVEVMSNIQQRVDEAQHLYRQMITDLDELPSSVMSKFFRDC